MFQPYTKNYDINNNIGTGLGLSVVKELTIKLGTPIHIQVGKMKALNSGLLYL